ncbi:sensor histidine kinase [Nonomuraea phyllanthi]|uniref:sensor histidine kinase n=1 Tax=Nonomuraea phyllanthi TaxID=2219224 RepID=UPI00186B518B|nr:histidine kinase [Nonomuraea phyllanthi]
MADAGAGRDRVTIAGSFACALVAAVVVVHGDLGGTAPTWYLVADVVGGAAACAALWLSRRWPATVALAVVAISVPSAAASCAAGVATLIAALHRRSAVAIGVGAAWVAATLIRFWLRPPGLAPYPVWALVAVLFGAALTGWGMLARARRQLVSSLVERARRAEEEQRGRAEQARRAERLAIAREMHDVLAHRLSLLALHAGALEFNARADPGEVVEAASVVRASAHQALQELRQVISVLREAPVLAELDLPALVAEVRRAGMEVDIRDGGVRLPDLPGATARAAYRIVQEGLTNARKHAPGRPVSVRLEGSPDEGLTVEVRNPVTGTPGPEGAGAGMQGGEATGPAGTGMPRTGEAGSTGMRRDEGADQTGRPRGGGTGVAGMAGIEGAGLAGVRERAELAGGRVERAGVEAGEFRLAVWLPWPV